MPNNLHPIWGDEYGDKLWQWVCHGNSNCMFWHQEQVLRMTSYRENKRRLRIQKKTSDQGVRRNESWLVWQVLDFKVFLDVYLDPGGSDFFFFPSSWLSVVSLRQRHHLMKQFPWPFPTYLFNHSEASNPFDMIPYHRWGSARMREIIL